MDDVCKCDVNLKPLTDWVSEEDEQGKCRPCQVPQIVADYKRALIDAGLEEVVSEMGIDGDTTPEDVCQLLDSLVEASDSELRCELEQINCKYQTDDPDDTELDRDESDSGDSEIEDLEPEED
jgi:hypothetical protein